jgi:predicted metal-dependent hydrolase
MLIEMNGFSVTLQRKCVKNINLRIRRSGEVQISAPIKTPIDVIHSFLHHKRSWIEMHRYRLRQLEQQVPQNLIVGEYIDFQGTKYVLHLHEIQTNQRIELNENQIHFFVKPGASQSHKELLLTKWYRSKMEQFLPPLFDKWQSIMGVTGTQVSIKRMKSRWGTCHPIKKHITLNLQLIEKPSICLEYVIVHELVHLFEASHNQRFYALMSHYLPDWKQIKKQLSYAILNFK